MIERFNQNYFLNPKELLDLFLPRYDHFSFVIYGARGSLKTTHLYGIYEELKESNVNVIFGYDIEDIEICDVLILDDFASKFYKRDFGTTENKEFVKTLQEIRTNIPMVISSCPHYNLMDKDFRDFFNPAPILKPGYINLDGKILVVKPPSKELELEMRAKENKGRKERFMSSIAKIKEARRKKASK